LLLNPDTLVEEDTFHKCLAFMDAHPDAGALGVKLIDGSGKYLPESKRGFPSPWVAFCKTFGLSALFPRSRVFNRYYLGHLSENETHEVDVLVGAFMFMRRAALDRAGLLDDGAEVGDGACSSRCHARHLHGLRRRSVGTDGARRGCLRRALGGQPAVRVEHDGAGASDGDQACGGERVDDGLEGHEDSLVRTSQGTRRIPTRAKIGRRR
ncbi:MAG TPA: hypothetical protein PL196_02880, partial [Burkholderiaceae bacterium]|nr:hypothetical protein [Burkholderiaceae bacterium]